MMEINHTNQEVSCLGLRRGTGQRFMYFMIGGGIGAAIALLLAPKSGSELRNDIANLAAESFDETLSVANEMKRRTSDYYEAANEKGSEILEVVVARASALKEEVGEDVEKIGAIVDNSSRRPDRFHGTSIL